MAYVVTETIRLTIQRQAEDQDKRERQMVFYTFTKGATDVAEAIDTGLSEIEGYFVTGNVVSKPMFATVSSGTLTIDDDRTAANTAGSCFAIGRL